MKQFMGVKYEIKSGTQWSVVWPSGLRGIINANDEDELIEKLRALLENK